MHLFSPRIYLSVHPTIVLSTDTHNWHDYDAFQLPNSAEQYELIDMSHYHEICISRFFLICSLMGCKAVLHISRQNNYVRIGPVTEAVLSAIVFVSMIADGPMEMAIIVSDPQQNGA
jgi:hypothetical protein